MSERGMNPKTLQYLMGHADITVTLNVYTHASYTKVADEMAQITAV
jgi:site-specific recombinase XerD